MQLASPRPYSAAAEQIEFWRYESAAANWESLSRTTLPVGLNLPPFLPLALLDAAEHRRVLHVPSPARPAPSLPATQGDLDPPPITASR